MPGLNDAPWIERHRAVHGVHGRLRQNSARKRAAFANPGQDWKVIFSASVFALQLAAKTFDVAHQLIAIRWDRGYPGEIGVGVDPDRQRSLARQLLKRRLIVVGPTAGIGKQHHISTHRPCRHAHAHLAIATPIQRQGRPAEGDHGKRKDRDTETIHCPPPLSIH